MPRNINPTALAVYDAQLHPTLDGVAASRTDAKRMLEASSLRLWVTV